MKLTDTQREKYFNIFLAVALYTALYPVIFYTGLKLGDKKSPNDNTYILCNDIGLMELYSTKQLSTVIFFGLLAWGMKNNLDNKAWWWIFIILFGIWMIYSLILYRFMGKNKQN